jgi:DNA-binding HxlR family transcriptional regulator
LLSDKRNRARTTPLSVAAMVESVLGCKWSLRVLDLVRRDIRRPGAMERATPGLSAKVLNERLGKLVRFGVLDREVFAEIPPRVEYSLTPFGARFVTILEQIQALQRELQDGSLAPPPERGGEPRDHPPRHETTGLARRPA